MALFRYASKLKKGSPYLYKWDFTKSLVDEVHKREAVLLRLDSSTDYPIRDNYGVHIVSSYQGLNLLSENDIFNTDKDYTIEVKFGNCTTDFSSGSRQVLTFKDSLQTKYTWVAYNHYYWNLTINGNLQNNDVPIKDRNNLDAFSNNRLIVNIKKNGHIEIYNNDTLYFHKDNVYMNNHLINWLNIGSESVSSTFSQMVIEQVLIYENEEV